jgi:imidazolonepropionase
MFLTNLQIATMTSGYGLIEKGFVRIDGGRIAEVGPDRGGVDGIDCGGRLLTPGLIDCHTHLIHGGNRAQEFEMRLKGRSYAEIAQAGGGILSTVRATRAASEEELVLSGLRRLDPLLAEGVTTVEIKSGYGLDIDTEIKMLRAAWKLGEQRPVDVVTSYLGAHALPPEYRESRQDYIRLICEEALPKISELNLADAVDGFCEGIAFTPQEIDQVFAAAQELGLPVKLHAEQLSNLGGAKVAARYHALSVDHVEYLDESGVDAIAEAGCVAVLLPGAFYYLHEKQRPPLESLRFAGVPMAVATDLNPGSSPVHSLLAAMNMACVLFGLTPEEALSGVTAHAARALGLSDRGVIAPGMKADLVLWDAGQPGELAYPLGFNPLAAVIRNGQVVRGQLP